MDSNKILDTDTENLTEEEKLERFKKLTDILSRDISRRLDEINSHINAIDLALESVLDLYNTVLEDHDEIALVTLIRIANKSIWIVETVYHRRYQYGIWINAKIFKTKWDDLTLC